MYFKPSSGHILMRIRLLGKDFHGYDQGSQFYTQTRQVTLSNVYSHVSSSHPSHHLVKVISLVIPVES